MSDSPQHSVRPKPVVLCILDGWGERAETENNAIALGETPTWDRLVSSVPRARLDASGQDVGLPAGQMGNSEVGHMNIGAGRIVMQDLPRIDAALNDGTLAANPKLKTFVDALKESGGACHLLGLLSPGGVHSHQDQMAALARLVADAGVPVRVHAFLDGRDAPPRDASKYMANFLGDIAGADISVATVSGRYYAMDRDNRWDRVEKAYRALRLADGVAADDPIAAIEASYADDVGDEFMLPAVIGDYVGMGDGDGLFMANFRADRAREILAALADPDFVEFQRVAMPAFSARLGLVEYSAELAELFPTLFPPLELKAILGQVVSEAGLKQLRIAETEKYAHVTFFLNGGREAMFEGEKRILIPSPKVATYDLQPEMSAPEVTNELVRVIGEGTFDLIVVNFANGDMVGHTGILEAARAAAAAIDASLTRLEASVIQAGGVMIITADHGNCEMMVDRNADQPHTQHTLNAVPVLMVNAPDRVVKLHDGRLCDLAPTVLNLLGLDQPEEMTGRCLIVEDAAQTVAAQ